MKSMASLSRFFASKGFQKRRERLERRARPVPYLCLRGSPHLWIKLAPPCQIGPHPGLRLITGYCLCLSQASEIIRYALQVRCRLRISLQDRPAKRFEHSGAPTVWEDEYASPWGPDTESGDCVRAGEMNRSEGGANGIKRAGRRTGLGVANNCYRSDYLAEFLVAGKQLEEGSQVVQ